MKYTNCTFVNYEYSSNRSEELQVESAEIEYKTLLEKISSARNKSELFKRQLDLHGQINYADL